MEIKILEFDKIVEVFLNVAELLGYGDQKSQNQIKISLHQIVNKAKDYEAEIKQIHYHLPLFTLHVQHCLGTMDFKVIEEKYTPEEFLSIVADSMQKQFNP